MSAKPIKTSGKHPYAAIEWRVIDCSAYADLTFSARALLVQIVRQLTKTNNGHLQATFSDMERFGFSVNTLSRATHELIGHGFIYKTKVGGFHQGAAQFAVTWLSVTNTHGIFMQGFKSCAWRDWQPEKKTRAPKVNTHSIKNGEQTPPIDPKSDAIPCPKSEHIVVVPIGGNVSACPAVDIPELAQPQPDDQPGGYQLSKPPLVDGIKPDDQPADYTRNNDDDLTAEQWDSERGEMMRSPPPRTRMAGAAIDLTRSQLAGLQRRSA